MLNFEKMSLTTQLYVMLLTKLQEITFKMHILASDEKLRNFMLNANEKLHKAHYRVFYGLDYDRVVENVRSGEMGSEAAMKVIQSHIKPYIKRVTAMDCKILSVYKGMNFTSRMVENLQGATLVATIYGISLAEAMQLIMEKNDAARKAT